MSAKTIEDSMAFRVRYVEDISTPPPLSTLFSSERIFSVQGQVAGYVSQEHTHQGCYRAGVAQAGHIEGGKTIHLNGLQWRGGHQADLRGRDLAGRASPSASPVRHAGRGARHARCLRRMRARGCAMA